LFHWTDDTVQSWLYKPGELPPTFHDANLGGRDGKEAWNAHEYAGSNEIHKPKISYWKTALLLVISGF
jgi:hypothetical protein